MSIKAEVIHIAGTMGIKGVRRVRCKVLEGRDENKILTRNVVGPIEKGDIILIKETAMDTEAGFR